MYATAHVRKAAGIVLSVLTSTMVIPAVSSIKTRNKVDAGHGPVGTFHVGSRTKSPGPFSGSFGRGGSVFGVVERKVLQLSWVIREPATDVHLAVKRDLLLNNFGCISAMLVTKSKLAQFEAKLAEVSSGGGDGLSEEQIAELQATATGVPGATSGPPSSLLKSISSSSSLPLSLSLSKVLAVFFCCVPPHGSHHRALTKHDEPSSIIVRACAARSMVQDKHVR